MAKLRCRSAVPPFCPELLCRKVASLFLDHPEPIRAVNVPVNLDVPPISEAEVIRAYEKVGGTKANNTDSDTIECHLKSFSEIVFLSRCEL